MTDQETPPYRRWYQFRLRTLLVLMAISAIPFALIGREIRAAYRDKATADWVVKQGGIVEFNEGWLTVWTGGALNTVNLSRTHVTDADLEHIRNLTDLQSLNLSGTQVADAGLENLQDLTALQLLDLSGTQVAGAGLEHLQDLWALQSLFLRGAQVTDAGLEYLQDMTALQALILSRTQVTDEGVARLKKSLPNCYFGR